MRMRELVAAVDAGRRARARGAEQAARARPARTPTRRSSVDAIAGKLLTEPVRYGKPGLQAHITYLAGMTAGADQKVGRDALERYAVLKKELDAIERRGGAARSARRPARSEWQAAPAPGRARSAGTSAMHAALGVVLVFVEDAQPVVHAHRAQGADEDVRAARSIRVRTTPFSVTCPSSTSTVMTVRRLPLPVQKVGSSSNLSVMSCWKSSSSSNSEIARLAWVLIDLSPRSKAPAGAAPE